MVVSIQTLLSNLSWLALTDNRQSTQTDRQTGRHTIGFNLGSSGLNVKIRLDKSILYL